MSFGYTYLSFIVLNRFRLTDCWNGSGFSDDPYPVSAFSTNGCPKIWLPLSSVGMFICNVKIIFMYPLHLRAITVTHIEDLHLKIMQDGTWNNFSWTSSKDLRSVTQLRFAASFWHKSTALPEDQHRFHRREDLISNKLLVTEYFVLEHYAVWLD
jgi:hypothetical protein